MDEISIRDLRNAGGDVIQRVVNGEDLTVTRSGKPVALLMGVRRATVRTAGLRVEIARLPAVDPDLLRRDLERRLDHRA
jgi:prevent-host-death family protein